MYKRILLPMLFLTGVAVAQVQAVSATIDAGRTGAPISKYVYGQFIEHIAGTINSGIWAEMLNPTEGEQQLRLSIRGVELSGQGRVWRMAPASINASIVVGQKPGVEVEEQVLEALPGTVKIAPISVNIYEFAAK